MFHRISTALIVIMLAGVAFAAEGTFDRTLKVNGPVDMDVQTGSGNITVRAASDASTVQVHGIVKTNYCMFCGGGRYSAEEKVRRIVANPPIDQTGNNIRIGRIDDSDLKNVSISYEITVPQATALRTKSGSGDEQIQGVKGPLEAQSGSGTLRIRDIGSEVKAGTGSGDVELTNIQSHVRANTGSGSIKADAISGGLVATTGSGNIEYRQTAPGDVQVNTGSGSIQLTGVKGALRAETGSGDIEAEGEPSSSWDVHTGSGTVSLRLPSDASFDLHARTSSGSIDLGFPVTVQGQLGKHEVRGKVRNGGPLLSLQTGSGDIRVH